MNYQMIITIPMEKNFLILFTIRRIPKLLICSKILIGYRMLLFIEMKIGKLFCYYELKYSLSFSCAHEEMPTVLIIYTFKCVKRVFIYLWQNMNSRQNDLLYGKELCGKHSCLLASHIPGNEIKIIMPHFFSNSKYLQLKYATLINWFQK